MGVGKRSRDLLLKFWDIRHISETVGARNFKFCSSMQNGIIRDDQLDQIETGSIIPIWQMSVFSNQK